MANNFKLTGDYYVSKDGSDSNSGLTKDLPKLTVQAGLNLVGAVGVTKTVVIGAGVYTESISKQTSAGIVTLVGDGSVVLDGGNIRTMAFLSQNSHTLIFSNMEIKNYASITTTYQNGLVETQFTDCVLKNSTVTAILIAGNIVTRYLRSKLIGWNDTYLPVITSSIIINSVLGNVFVFSDNYINSASNLVISSGVTSFNYNNIQCPIVLGSATTVSSGTYQDIYGRYYDLSQAGTNPSGNGSLAQPYYRAQTASKAFSYTNHRILYPLVNINSISTDPLFNNILTQDFTLQATSPMLGTASDSISNIGGTKYAGRHTAKGTTFNAGAISVTNLTFLGNDYVVSGAASGEVISAPLFHSSTTKIIQKISYNGLYEFNKALGAGPVTGNRNVPDELVYTTGTQGAKPDRLVYSLRYSTQTAEPTVDAEWDNGGNWVAGDYEVFEWNTKPSIDSATKGNGQPDFNAADTPVYLNATWVQLKVKLRNDYV
jgi:hypothetical protein